MTPWLSSPDTLPLAENAESQGQLAAACSYLDVKMAA